MNAVAEEIYNDIAKEVQSILKNIISKKLDLQLVKIARPQQNSYRGLFLFIDFIDEKL